jgi:hypothetical protein
MTTMASTATAVIGGIDTHADVHVAAACDQVGTVLGTESFPTTVAGYRQLLGWLRSFGEVTVVGIEGTGSYGVGLTRFLLEHYNDSGTPAYIMYAVLRPVGTHRVDRRRVEAATWIVLVVVHRQEATEQFGVPDEHWHRPPSPIPAGRHTDDGPTALDESQVSEATDQYSVCGLTVGHFIQRRHLRPRRPEEVPEPTALRLVTREEADGVLPVGQGGGEPGSLRQLHARILAGAYRERHFHTTHQALRQRAPGPSKLSGRG